MSKYRQRAEDTQIHRATDPRYVTVASLTSARTQGEPSVDADWSGEGDR